MASLLVSINFSMLLSAPKFSPRELQQRKSAVTRLSSQATTRTATNRLVLCNSIRDILSVNQSFCGYLTTPTNLYYELVSSCIHDGVLKGAYFCPNHKKEQKLAYTPTKIFCLMLLALF
ncbi:hypothetical protein OIU79_023456 [Salix purpurea]|uniref:Uncharacterized protein n=1 Tax=Salix purpurea TaxID=77065 RepID=A0A9Q1A906_SALPP|nr:hypothetical protein OIU79_023456 [Salix purpurea]